tara:strand:+ start:858 stop:1157 length:300 start_codon:yes stop_codon:yes gene_type:complete
VCSDEFGPLARAESRVLGQAALPLIPIPHPLAGNDRELVASKANAIADEVASVLIDSVEELSARYENRFLSLTERRLDGGAVCVDEVCALEPAILDIQT